MAFGPKGLSSLLLSLLSFSAWAEFLFSSARPKPVARPRNLSSSSSGSGTSRRHPHRGALPPPSIRLPETRSAKPPCKMESPTSPLPLPLFNRAFFPFVRALQEPDDHNPLSFADLRDSAPSVASDPYKRTQSSPSSTSHLSALPFSLPLALARVIIAVAFGAKVSSPPDPTNPRRTKTTTRRGRPDRAAPSRQDLEEFGPP